MGKFLSLVLLSSSIVVVSQSAFASEPNYDSPPPAGTITHIPDKNGYSCQWFEFKTQTARDEFRSANELLPSGPETPGPILKKHLDEGTVVRHECDSKHWSRPIRKKPSKNTPAPMPTSSPR